MKYFAVLCLLLVLSVVCYANVIRESAEENIADDSVSGDKEMAVDEIEGDQACDGTTGAPQTGKSN